MPASSLSLAQALNTFLKEGLDKERVVRDRWSTLLRYWEDTVLGWRSAGEPEGPFLVEQLARVFTGYLQQTHARWRPLQTAAELGWELWLPGLIIWAAYLSPEAQLAAGERWWRRWEQVIVRLDDEEFVARSPLGGVADSAVRQFVAARVKLFKEAIGKETVYRETPSAKTARKDTVSKERARREVASKEASFYRLRLKGVELLAQAVLAEVQRERLPIGTTAIPLPPAGVPWRALGLPRTYVERTELATLREWLLTADGPGSQALVVSGMASAGKTTLDAALAHEAAVRATFMSGILWADTRQVVTQLGHQAKLSGWDGDLAAAWQRWAGDPTRRALVILDDVVDPGVLSAVASDLGPGLTFLVRTQFGDDVRLALQRLWGAGANVTLQQLIHLSQPDAYSLFAWVLGRSLADEERERVTEIGDRLGGHTGALVFAVSQVRADGWGSMLTGLREGRLPAERQLERVVQGQWERPGDGRRTRFAALFPQGQGGGPLGALYAMAVWVQTGPTQTEADPVAFERIGFLERLQVPANGANLCYLRAPLWRAAPVVERALRQRVALERWSPSDRLMVASRLRDYIRRVCPVPWQFQVLMTLWWLVWGGVKLWRDAWEAVLGLVRRGRERKEPSELARQLRWGVPGTAQELMAAFWRSQGVEPAPGTAAVAPDQHTAGQASPPPSHRGDPRCRAARSAQPDLAAVASLQLGLEPASLAVGWYGVLDPPTRRVAHVAGVSLRSGHVGPAADRPAVPAAGDAGASTGATRGGDGPAASNESSSLQDDAWTPA